MSVPVTIDSEDLEALLFATAAIKSVEAALRQAKDDPFLNRVKPRITVAHDRIATAWREAQRREQHPERFAPATPDEIAYLVALWPKPADEGDLRFMPIRLGVGHPSPQAASSADPVKAFHAEAMDRRRDIRALMTRGLVEIGVRLEVHHWGSSGECTVRDVAEHWVRITRRGIDAVIAAEQ